ncbi:Crp/Fnr family transcriptional regulator [Kordiimonas sp. SCSIO 12603]|uniref:Crp/Fnr family transcriptional regulator n=1 Tax=Kordiimonas sp. SCSIO 12603 TaxID=2829596 RepID=UPI0021080EA2|nr:Crp/Fnr family transcriptional regulator [Kordiimonas sp. SCSIO 12603]UTW59769.1 Crp/Fnr family transcriptional regulator [Kordiimonas sp. SCSIO 12603]
MAAVNCKKADTKFCFEDIIARHSLFAAMPDTLVEGFVHAAQPITVSKGSTLFMQNDEAEWFYIITKGWVKLFRETLDGDEAVIDMVTTGHIFGESAIIDDGIHSFGATAVEECDLLRFPSKMLKAAVAENHAVALAMLGSMSRHRKQQTREIESLNLQNASQRIGCFLLRLCRVNDVEPISLQLPYDKSLIAARLGMKSETFSRALNKLRNDTSIAVKGSNVEIPEIDALSHYACTACSSEFPCDDLH